MRKDRFRGGLHEISPSESRLPASVSPYVACTNDLLIRQPLYRLAPPSQRSKIVKQLEELKVYVVTHVVLERYVSLEGQLVQGRTEAGKLVFQETVEDIKIYISRQDLASKKLPVDLLSERLSMFCGISTDAEYLVTNVLALIDLDSIEAMLERKGIKKRLAVMRSRPSLRLRPTFM